MKDLTENSNNDELKTKSSGMRSSLLGRLISILRQQDSPHRIAIGAALGIFIGILPIMGIQMAVVTLLALAFRGNLKTAVAGVWISNPITFIPMYFGYYKFGLLFFPTRYVSWIRFKSQVAQAADWNWKNVVESSGKILALGADILIPMWIGASILAVPLGILTYFVTHRIVTGYRSKNTG